MECDIANDENEQGFAESLPVPGNPFKTLREVGLCINDCPIYPCFHSLQFITATAAIESLRAQMV
jgi:hypothetical protein